METPKSIIDAAEQVARILKDQQVESVVIGAMALAAYHYVRLTHDLDLAVNADIPTLRRLEEHLRRAGFQAELHEPDADEPLGGVLDVSGPFGKVQIVSFAGRFPGVIEDAIRAATAVVRPGSPLKLVPMPHLVALKLYAGGMKSRADIVELLRRKSGRGHRRDPRPLPPLPTSRLGRSARGCPLSQGTKELANRGAFDLVGGIPKSAEVSCQVTLQRLDPGVAPRAVRRATAQPGRSGHQRSWCT